MTRRLFKGPLNSDKNVKAFLHSVNDYFESPNPSSIDAITKNINRAYFGQPADLTLEPKCPPPEDRPCEGCGPTPTPQPTPEPTPTNTPVPPTPTPSYTIELLSAMVGLIP
jgi:hypothetical protein